MTQLQLPIDLKETRRARIERIAAILNGPPSGLVHQASVYFDERAFDEATARAQEGGHPTPHRHLGSSTGGWGSEA